LAREALASGLAREKLRQFVGATQSLATKAAAAGSP